MIGRSLETELLLSVAPRKSSAKSGLRTKIRQQLHNEKIIGLA